MLNNIIINKNRAARAQFRRRNLSQRYPEETVVWCIWCISIWNNTVFFYQLKFCSLMSLPVLWLLSLAPLYIMCVRVCVLCTFINVCSSRSIQSLVVYVCVCVFVHASHTTHVRARVNTFNGHINSMNTYFRSFAFDRRRVCGGSRPCDWRLYDDERANENNRAQRAITCSYRR